VHEPRITIIVRPATGIAVYKDAERVAQTPLTDREALNLIRDLADYIYQKGAR